MVASISGRRLLGNRVKLVLRWCARLAGTPVMPARVTISHPLLAFCLHPIPLLLLGRVQEPANLRVGHLPDVHHFSAPILLRKRSVLMQTFHLGLLGLQSSQHFRLLIRREIEFLGQSRGALGGIRLTMITMMSATVFLRGRLIVGLVILCGR